VSTDEQRTSGAGLAAQRAAIEAECRRRGWQLVEVIEDAGYSAKDLKRPGVAKRARWWSPSWTVHRAQCSTSRP